jgi:hypothetical protein
MKRLALLATVLVLGLVSTGCIHDFSFGADIEGSGVRASEERDLEAFSYIALVGSPDVNVTVGEEQSVLVEADDNLLEVIETRVRGRTLKIDSDESYSSRMGVVITITVPEIEGVSVTGSGDVVVMGVDAASFSASVTGSGDVHASGKATSVEAKVTGSGDIDLWELEAEEGYATVTGSGDIRIHATEELSAKIMGSGDIEYSGSPSTLTTKAMGSGDIIAR